MVRRVMGSLAVTACLFGILQPAFACATTSSGCCPAGSPTSCSSDWLLAPAGTEATECCASRPTSGASALHALRVRHSSPHASGSPDPVIHSSAFAPTQESAIQPLTRQTPRLYRADQSQTYLRTARLRL